jgi:hypothetical protein
MVRVNVIVEGQTEETFIRDFLSKELAHEGIFLSARCIETGRKQLKIHRGGMTSYPKAKKDIETWLRQDTNAFVTTMFDLYALPNDFPGMETCTSSGIERSIFLETQLKEDISNIRFLPYIQTHEFEALLFCDPLKFDEVIPDCNISRQLQLIKNAYTSPELINDSRETAPSKRILGLHKSYNKVLYGTRIVKRIGLQNLMAQCEHFALWIHSLRNISS